MNGLTNGRMVHYVDEDGTHEAAVIIRVVDEKEGVVSLFVFIFTDNVVYDVKYNETGKPLTWHWIERKIPEENV